MSQVYLVNTSEGITLNIVEQGIRTPLRIVLDEAQILKLIAQGSNILYNERRLFNVSRPGNLSGKRVPLRDKE